MCVCVGGAHTHTHICIYICVCVWGGVRVLYNPINRGHGISVNAPLKLVYKYNSNLHCHNIAMIRL